MDDNHGLSEEAIREIIKDVTAAKFAIGRAMGASEGMAFFFLGVEALVEGLLRGQSREEIAIAMAAATEKALDKHGTPSK